MSRNSAPQKIFATQTNTCADSRPISASYFIFRSPPVEISRNIFSTQILVFLTFKRPTILSNFFRCWTSFHWYHRDAWGEPKEQKPQANQLGLNWSGAGKKAKRSEAKLSAVERCDWISTTAAALLNSASYIGWMGTYCSVKLSKAYNWKMLKGLIFNPISVTVIKQSHSACSTDNRLSVSRRKIGNF